MLIGSATFTQAQRKLYKMALKFKDPDRFVKPDPRYKSMLVSKFINCLMKEGKKSLAQAIFYRAMEVIEGRVEDKSPLEVFEEAIGNVKPLVEVRSRRIGGMTYQVPCEVRGKRQISLAIRWIVQAARSKKGRPMYLRLADEILDGYHKQGSAYERRENAHKMAEANRAFAHFRVR